LENLNRNKYTALQQISKSRINQFIIRKINIMSLLNLAFSLNAADVLRVLLGLGVLLALLIVFKPLVLGILRAALMLMVPRKSLEQRLSQHRFNGVQILNRMANDYAGSQPNLATELRNLAACDR